jgi:hypothetical protein
MFSLIPAHPTHPMALNILRFVSIHEIDAAS